MTSRKSHDRLRGRNGAAWQAYLDGETQDSIAARLGISQARVSQILDEVRRSIPTPVIEEIATAERDRVARLYQETMRIIATRHPLVSTARGIVIRDDETGEPLEDVGPRLAAIGLAMRIHDRVARAFGLDAPDRLEATVTREVSPAERAWQDTITEARDRRRQARALLENEAAGVRAIGAAS